MKFQDLANLAVEWPCKKEVNPAISVKHSGKADPTLEAQLGRVEDNGHCGLNRERRDAQQKKRENRRVTVEDKREGEATEVVMCRKEGSKEREGEEKEKKAVWPGRRRRRR